MGGLPRGAASRRWTARYWNHAIQMCAADGHYTAKEQAKVREAGAIHSVSMHSAIQPFWPESNLLSNGSQSCSAPGWSI